MENASQSKSAYISELSRELLDDLELSRLPTESLLFKIARLARITDHELVERIISYELHGAFSKDDNDTKSWLISVGRIAGEAIVSFEPLSAIDARIAANQAQLQALRIPDLSYAPKSASEHDHVGPGWAGNPITQGISSVINQQRESREVIARLSGIKSRILSFFHRWVLNVYHQALFSGQQETLFEKVKSKVDNKLAERCGNALKKVPSVIERLGAGDQEAVSHALSTCRRILDSFCDAIYPPSDTPVELSGEQLKVTAQNTKSRFCGIIARANRVATACGRHWAISTIAQVLVYMPM